MADKSSEFNFSGCIEITELLGHKANDVQKLLELIEDVPPDSIYYHTHSYFLRHDYFLGPYPNDFANWITIQVRDRILGERLAQVMPHNDSSIDDLRFELIDIIDQHLMMTKTIPHVEWGKPFYFMQSQILEVPTDLKADNLKKFVDGLKLVDLSAIYYHVYEARTRIQKGRSDFSIWLAQQLGLEELALEIEKIDSYMYSLDDLRDRIISICEREL